MSLILDVTSSAVSDRFQNEQKDFVNFIEVTGPFSQLITCAVPGCGCQIIYDPKKKFNCTTGQEREYHYYHCTDGKGVHKRLGIPQMNVAEEKIWK